MTFDRTATREATAARQADCAAVRADLALDLLDDTAHARCLLSSTDAQQVANAAKAVSMLVTAYARMESVGAQQDSAQRKHDYSAVDLWLDHITGGPPMPAQESMPVE